MCEKDNSVKKIKIISEKETKVDVWIKILKIVASIATTFASIVGIIVGGNIIHNQTQQQEQTQIVIEPRDGDVIVAIGNDYKLLQLIEVNDINFPTTIQEIQHTYKNSIVDNRVDILNENNEDWGKRDSFSYMINNFSINSNKIINLLDNIDKITVFCDFYAEKNISTFIELGDKTFSFSMIDESNKNDFSVSNINKKSEYEYVTKEANDGIEWVKIRVEITYNINNKKIRDSIASDWIPTDADLI